MARFHSFDGSVIFHFIYIYIYIYVYIYIYIYIHTHMYIYIYIMCICTYVYIHTHTHIYIYTHIHTHHFFFIHSYINGHLGCFCIPAVVNYVAINTGAHVSFKLVFSFFQINTRMVWCFYFFYNLHTVFHNGCTNLFSYQ